MKRKTPLMIAGVALAGVVLAWIYSYARHFKEIVPAKPLPERMSVQDVHRSFQEDIQPILDQKCVQCHTDTKDRPFFYHIPGLSAFTRPYVEKQIEEGREQFDFSKGLNSERLGSAMEAVVLLRDAIKEGSMPPAEYRWARPSRMINEKEKQMILEWTRVASLAMEDEMFGGPAGPDEFPADEAEFGKQFAESLMASSPLADPSDKAARDAAAEAVAKNPYLRGRMSAPFLWGGQKAPGNYNLYDAHLTRFNPLVWRKHYLSLFMFEGTYEVVKNGEFAAYVFPIRFRSGLGDGEYPYPFWHTEAKWQKYNEAKNLIFLVKGGKIVASFRSADKKETIPQYAKKAWDGKFRWWDDQNKVVQPRVNNFSATFSPSNPHLPALERNYQQLALAFRSENCLTCHSPDNKGHMAMLELLSSPTHALESRDRLLGILEVNQMPPITGINDHEVKSTFMDLAQEFKRLGDMAFQYENEPLRDGIAASDQKGSKNSARLE